jgi:hypothetical protein
MGTLRQDGLADETVGPNITWLDLTWLVTNNSGRSTRTRKQRDNHGNFAVEELEVGFWKFILWLEDFIYV